MKKSLFWILFFIICMGVGFLHGILPQGLTRSFFTRPKNIHVITTDEILFPPQIQKKLETELQVRFSVTVTRHWNTLLSGFVTSPSADLVLLPSSWAETLKKQNLLSDISVFKTRVAADFLPLKSEGQDFTFLPFYWMKTHIQTPSQESFSDFLKNKSEPTLFLLADEDLLLKHFELWKALGVLDLLLQKKILTLQLDQILKKEHSELHAIELPTKEKISEDDRTLTTRALLIWGAVIPANSTQKEVVLEILDTLTTTEHQESTLLQTPFNSTFNQVVGKDIPPERRADSIRNLQLKDTLLLNEKDPEAQQKLKEQFNLTL